MSETPKDEVLNQEKNPKNGTESLDAEGSLQGKKSWFKRHPVVVRILGLLIGILVIVFMLFYTGIHENINYLRNINLGWLVLAGLILVLSYLLRGLRWKFLLVPYRSNQFNPSVIKLTNYVYFGNFTNLILPLKMGDVTKGLVMTRRESGEKFTNLFATIVLERIFDLIAIGLLIILPVFYFGVEFLFKENLRLTSILAFGLIGAVILFVVILLWKKEFVLGIIEWFLVRFPVIKQRENYQFEIKNVFEQINNCLVSTFEHKGRTLMILGSSALIWILEGCTAFFTALAIGVPQAILLIISAVIIANFLKAFPVTPGGIGFYELGLFLILSIGGVPEAAASVIAIIDHLIKNLILLGLGGAMTLYFGVKITEVPQIPAEDIVKS